MKNILKIVFVIIGTLIGAGFASGQEMYIFFFSYGLEGIAGLFVSNILMGIIIYVSLKIINKYKIKNYKEFLNIIIKNLYQKMSVDKCLQCKSKHAQKHDGHGLYAETFNKKHACR